MRWTKRVGRLWIERLEKGADGPYTANPYETSNEQKDTTRSSLLSIGKHGGKTSEEDL